MKTKLFMILFGLALLIPIQAAQAQYGGEYNNPNLSHLERIADGVILTGRTWSSPSFHPEVGDRIIGVNGYWVRSESDFRLAVRYSPHVIYLLARDHRTGNTYYLRTHLWPASNQTRLGIYVSTARDRDGVIVTGWWSNCPGTRCQYIID